MAKKTISLQLDEEVIEAMQILAGRNARSRAAEMGVALKRYIQEELGEVEQQPKQVIAPTPISDVILAPAAKVKDKKGLL